MIDDLNMTEVVALSSLITGSTGYLAIRALLALRWQTKMVLQISSQVIGYGGYDGKAKSFDDDRRIRGRSEELCQIARDNLRNAIGYSEEGQRDHLRKCIKEIDKITGDLKNKARGDPSSFTRGQRRQLLKLDRTLIKELSKVASDSRGSSDIDPGELYSSLINAGEALTKRTALVTMR